MVCPRCILAVQAELNQLNIPVKHLELGEVETQRDLTDPEVEQLKERLEVLGFEWLADKKNRLVDQVKTAIVQLIYQKKELKENLSDYLSRLVNKDYTYISNLFSETEGITIEKYFIAQKIERVKELLIYDELSLSEIAFQLNYSSVSHLSTQFKRITGLTPTQFKESGQSMRKPIDLL